MTSNTQLKCVFKGFVFDMFNISRAFDKVFQPLTSKKKNDFLPRQQSRRRPSELRTPGPPSRSGLEPELRFRSARLGPSCFPFPSRPVPNYREFASESEPP